MLLRVRKPAPLRWALVLASLSAPALASAQEGKTFTQQPEAAPSRVRGEAVVPTRGASGPEALAKGPVLSWIWGPDDNKKYGLVTEFPGGA